MTLVNIATGEIAESITEADVDASIERVRRHAESIWDEWAWQVENQVWKVGNRWPSWDAMRHEVYGGLTNVTAPRAERPELIARFRAAGLTQAETAKTIGVTERTVQRNDMSDGKRGPAKNTTNVVFHETDGEVIEAEVVEDEPAPTTPPTRERDGATTWSRQVQNISASIPMEDLTEDELLELLGAVEYLHNYIKGERITRTGRNQQ